VIAEPKNETTYNIKGFIVGNGATDWKYDVFPSFPDVVYQFNIIPHSLWKAYNDMNCVYFFNSTMAPAANETACNDKFDIIMGLTDKLNWYDLFRHKYGDLSSSASDKTYDVWGRELEDYMYGKTELNGKEYTYKRGYTFADMVGGWNKNHPGVVM